MINGFVVNNSGRFRHIFKCNMSPGMKIALSNIYDLYKNKYDGKFDTKFLDWLQSTKIPEGSGFDIVVESIDDSDKNTDVSEPVNITLSEPVEDIPEEGAFESGKMPISKITARQIAGLKTKDNPKNIVGQVSSVHKLRRALTMTKDRAGKETLTRLIRDRILELQSVGIHA